jgi:hypothetical protein
MTDLGLRRCVACIAMVTVGTVCLVSGAWAECNAERCVGKVVRMQIRTDDNIVYIGMDGDERRLSCTPVSNLYVVLEGSQPLFRETFSALVAAEVSGTTVTVRINSSSQQCRVEYVILGQ